MNCNYLDVSWKECLTNLRVWYLVNSKNRGEKGYFVHIETDGIYSKYIYILHIAVYISKEIYKINKI